jgi:hypothetical protein
VLDDQVVAARLDDGADPAVVARHDVVAVHGRIVPRIDPVLTRNGNSLHIAVVGPR